MRTNLNFYCVWTQNIKIFIKACKQKSYKIAKSVDVEVWSVKLVILCRQPEISACLVELSIPVKIDMENLHSISLRDWSHVY